MRHRIPSDGKDNRIDILKRDGLMFTVESGFFHEIVSHMLKKSKQKLH